jgi:serine phosphatase RsbU (regulator of sigma subunit)
MRIYQAIKNIAIPTEYADEFRAQRIEFTRSRVKLFVFLSVGMYFFVTFIDLFLFNPLEFRSEEVYLWVVLAAGAAAILRFNSAVRTLRGAHLASYAFITLLLVILTKVCIIYADYALLTYSLYMFMLFLVSVVLPLSALDVLFVSLMHAAAYGFYFAFMTGIRPDMLVVPFTQRDFNDGMTFIAMAAVLCFIIRRKETARDIENFALLKAVESKNKRMEDELAFARRIHQTLIPKSISTDLADIAVMCLPMRQIGGDYTRFHFVEGERLVFIISDITGHGVPAALLVNRLHTEFERLAKDGKHPGELLKELDSFIRHDFEDTSMYLSAFCGMLEFKTGKFLYSNYGHPSQYIYRVTRSDIESLKSQTTLLGVPLKEDRMYQHSIEFEPGDMILLFTDGVIEVRNASGSEFGTENLEAFIRSRHALSVNDFNRELLDELTSFKIGDFRDDISILSIKIKK